jgi:poly-gamma-glutamate biosynthesis protein PgsC/CapC
LQNFSFAIGSYLYILRKVNPSLTLFIGLFVSFIILESTGIYPGGIIVPGFLSFYFPFPGRIIATFAIALVSVGVFRIVAERTLLFGRRRFFFMILTGALLTSLYNFLMTKISPAELLLPDTRVVGLIIPGLIANNTEKQGIVKTFSTAVIALVMTWFLSKLYLSFLGN